VNKPSGMSTKGQTVTGSLEIGKDLNW